MAINTILTKYTQFYISVTPHDHHAGVLTLSYHAYTYLSEFFFIVTGKIICQNTGKITLNNMGKSLIT